MADERYSRILGIEPTDEVPTYYELLGLAKTETDPAAVEAAYKAQIRKAQEIRTSKDKGFLEFLKEELRTARRTLADPGKRKAYDESLIADTVASFKAFVQPLMALGRISKSVLDTMIAKGVGDGLTAEHALTIVQEVAAASGATVETEEPAPAPAPAAYEDQESDYPEFDPDAVEEAAFSDEAVHDDAPPAPASAPQEVVLRAPERPAVEDTPRPTTFRKNDYYSGGASDFYTPTEPEAAPAAEDTPSRSPWARRGGSGSAEAASSSPWARGGSRSSSPWEAGGGRRGSRRPPPPREPSSTQQQRERWQDQATSRQIEEALRMFNMGAKLAKVAGDVHEKLRFYFPPANGKTTRTYQINGVSYEKVFETEQKTLRDTLKKYEGALSRAGAADGPFAERLRSEASRNITLLKGYLDEMRRHKLRLLGGLSQAEEVRAWQEFVNSQRSSRLTQTIEE